jgi:hypothetical protein
MGIDKDDSASLEVLFAFLAQKSSNVGGKQKELSKA